MTRAMDYDKAYRQTDSYFGEEPEPFFFQHFHLLDRARNVLDIGMGQGRHTLALARLGFAVEGIDPSSEAVHAADPKPGKRGCASTRRWRPFKTTRRVPDPWGVCSCSA